MRAVVHRVFRHGEGVFPGVDYSGGGSQQRGDGVFADVWLKRAQLVAFDDAYPRNAVRDAVAVQLFDGAPVLIVEGKHQRADALERNVQFAADIPGHAVALDVEPRHERARLRIVSGVDYGAVGACCAAGDVVFLIGQQHRQLHA